MSHQLPDRLMNNVSRHCRFMLLATLLVLNVCMSSAAFAAEPSPVPIVLVLKLVSDTRVQPTTGVVVSADGNVVVPAHFVREGDEIVVLDGGTDILKHARPATLIARSEVAGLALLSVKDMQRPAVRFAQLVMPSEGDLHFAAFPDAKRLAEGEAPLWVPVDVKPSPMPGEWFVSNVDTLPQIDGLVLDNCGQLAGIALASYPPSPFTGQARMIMGGRLIASLNELDVSLSSTFCDDKPESQRLAEESAQQGEPSQGVAGASTEIQLAEKRTIKPQKNSLETRPVPEPALPSGNQEPIAESNAPQTNMGAATPSVWSLIPVWLWVLIAALLAALIFKLGTLWRLVNRSPEPMGNQAPRHAPAIEPPTVELLAGTSGGPRNKKLLDDSMPDINSLPEGFNAVVSVVGEFGNGKSFTRYCIVNKTHIDIIIGRGDLNTSHAEISIQSPGVSRQHARLKGTASALTLSDLGSGNGTFIGAVPCLQGEIMFIEPNDEITLADVRFRIGVKIRYEQPA